MPTGDPLRPHSSSDPVSSPKWGASQKALLAHLQVFEGYFLFFFAVNHIPGQHLFAAFSGIHGLSSSWEKPRGFWGFPRWAVRLKEWSGLENYGSFAITALSTFHLNLQQRGHTEHQDWAPFPLHSTTTKRNSRVRAPLGWVAPIPPHSPKIWSISFPRKFWESSNSCLHSQHAPTWIRKAKPQTSPQFSSRWHTGLGILSIFTISY